MKLFHSGGATLGESGTDVMTLDSIPLGEREAVLKRIMARRPSESVMLDDDNAFAKTFLKLRREGYGLLDLKTYQRIPIVTASEALTRLTQP